jgi:hypothetical protein
MITTDFKVGLGDKKNKNYRDNFVKNIAISIIIAIIIRGARKARKSVVTPQNSYFHEIPLMTLT